MTNTAEAATVKIENYTSEDIEQIYIDGLLPVLTFSLGSFESCTADISHVDSVKIILAGGDEWSWDYVSYSGSLEKITFDRDRDGVFSMTINDGSPLYF